MSKGFEMGMERRGPDPELPKELKALKRAVEQKYEDKPGEDVESGADWRRQVVSGTLSKAFSSGYGREALVLMDEAVRAERFSAAESDEMVSDAVEHIVTDVFSGFSSSEKDPVQTIRSLLSGVSRLQEVGFRVMEGRLAGRVKALRAEEEKAEAQRNALQKALSGLEISVREENDGDR
jgi:hypothetical protein